MNAVDADEEAMYTSEKLVRRENVQRSRGLRVGDPQNAARVILVVRNATIAHAAVGNDRVQPRVGHGKTIAASRRLTATDEGIDSSVATVLLFDLAIALATHVEEDTTSDTCDGQDTNNNANSNGDGGWSTGLVLVGRGGRRGRTASDRGS